MESRFERAKFIIQVYLTEIEKLPLDDATPRTRVLRDAPVVVNLAVLES